MTTVILFIYYLLLAVESIEFLNVSMKKNLHIQSQSELFVLFASILVILTSWFLEHADTDMARFFL